jgi:hypothetical protein
MSDINIKITRIPPSFVGILYDWKISSKEITATLIDLILRQKVDVIADKLILRNNNNIKSFEKKILTNLFGNQQAVSFRQVKERIYNDKTLSIIVQGLIDENYVSQTTLDKIKEFHKQSIKQPKSQHHLYRPKDFNVKIVMLKSYHIKIIVGILFISLLTPMRTISTILLIFFGVIYFWIKKDIEASGITREELLTQKGEECKILATEAFNFFKKYPLSHDRLANEFVAYAVSLGFGKQWLAKLGGSVAKLQLFNETLESSSDTIGRLYDMESFIKEVYYQ